MLKRLAVWPFLILVLVSCSAEPREKEHTAVRETGKPVVYQVFTRLFGNQNATNKPWGTIEENGVGKFGDFTDAALEGIRELGVTHVWYTGVPHHALIRDYSAYGISTDDPDVVKGRAGSPYAVKDYYSVNPDLADDPARRMEEFRALVARTHRHGMKVVIDIVPNHVARGYTSLGKPEGVEDFGASDDTSVEYARDNNFYYVVGEAFEVPASPEGYAPVGGDDVPLADGVFEEMPAKWTGNGARKARPDFSDWFETVKVNYGVRPDGSYDFPRLPKEIAEKSAEAHYQFWRGRDVPDSWIKFRDIVLFWLGEGVDGFRYDMAEMVPVEFWSYLNSHILHENPDAFLLAEIYNPDAYRAYIQQGLMGYLYDKVGTYDTLKAIMQARAPASDLMQIEAGLRDIEGHMLHFLENHDEQRIASPDFAGDADIARPAMVYSALVGSAPTLLYFGQDVGEDGSEETGFGDPTRTSIFDYAAVPAHQRWMNGGRFDGGALTDTERALRDFYRRLLTLSSANPVFGGDSASLHAANLTHDGYDERMYSFVRWTENARVIVIMNFDASQGRETKIEIPSEMIEKLGLKDGEFPLKDLLVPGERNKLVVRDGAGYISVTLDALGSLVLEVET